MSDKIVFTFLRNFHFSWGIQKFCFFTGVWNLWPTGLLWVVPLLPNIQGGVRHQVPAFLPVCSVFRVPDPELGTHLDPGLRILNIYV
jgi:hypothetical protein